MTIDAILPVPRTSLSPAQFEDLAQVPPEDDWFNNLRRPSTRRVYRECIQDFINFAGLRHPHTGAIDLARLRTVRRSHVIAWRNDLQQRQVLVNPQAVAKGDSPVYRKLAGSTVRRKLAAISSLFKYLCEANAVPTNPVLGVDRPAADSNTQLTPALSNTAAQALLVAPGEGSLKGVRDSAILALLLYHGLRREEVSTLKVKDCFEDQGLPHILVHGKGDKDQALPLTPVATRLLTRYLELAGHGSDLDGPLFRPLRNHRGGGELRKQLHPQSIYELVKGYQRQTGLSIAGQRRYGPHALRKTAATNALEHGAEITKVQELLRHANIATTRLYDGRASKPEDNAAFHIEYK